MVRTFMAALLVGVVLCAGAAGAQDAGGGMGAKIIAARKANAALLQQYTWGCRTEIHVDDKLKDVRIDQVQYGPGGALQRTVMNNQTFNQPIGFFRKAIAESELKKVEQYLEGLRALMGQYTLPTAAKVDQFIGSASMEAVKAPDGTELLKLTGANVVNPGDTMSLWADKTTHKLRKVEISTSYEGAPATISATYKSNAAGLNYVSMAQVDVPSKKITVMVHDYDYEPND
ncbi:MAG: hypothetical protein JNK53_00370 [Phycisphaerae bacterium]|nr:hypothetical protein [Phycisphaerae bacterium]